MESGEQNESVGAGTSGAGSEKSSAGAEILGACTGTPGAGAGTSSGGAETSGEAAETLGALDETLGSNAGTSCASLAQSESGQEDTVLKNMLSARELSDTVYEALQKAELTDLKVFAKLTDTDVELFTKPFSLGVCVKLRECVMEARNIVDSEGTATSPDSAKSKHKRLLDRILVPDSDGIDLKSILNCYNGRIVQEYYRLNKSLDKSSRASLVRLIVDRLAAEGSVLDVTASWYKPIHEAISNMFSSEIDLYPTYERLIKQTKYNLSKKKKRLSGKLNQNLVDVNADNPQAHEPEMQSAKTWLQTGIEPDEEVLNQWQICFKLRQAEFKSTMYEKISTIFVDSNWPILGKPIGLRLIKYDFDRMFKPTSTIFKKWPLSKPRILQYATKELKSERSKGLILKYNGNPDDVTFAKILCALLPAGFVCKKLRANAAHTERGFVHTIETMNDIERANISYRSEMAKFGLTVQPHVIAVTNETSQSFFVYIDDGRMYTTKTLLEAIDGVFKLCMVLSAKYPAESRTVWTFVQKHFYGIKTDSDREYAVCSNLISAIERSEQ